MRSEDGTLDWALAAAAGAGLIACVALAGAATHTASVQGLGAPHQPMLPLTAVSLLVAAGALALARQRRAGRVASALAALVALVGALTLAEYALDRDLGLDGLLGVGVHVAGTTPGRIAANTATCLILIAGAILTLDRGRRFVRPAQACALLASVVALATLIGYLLNVPVLRRGFGSSVPNPMALSTALAILLLAAGVLLARPQVGIMALVRAAGPGGALVRRLAPAAILVPIAIAYLRLQGQTAGWYGTEEGLALFCVALVLISFALTIFTGRTLERVEAERLAGLARERAIVEASRDAIMSSGLDGRLTSWNAAAERIYGYAREEAIGRPPELLIGPRGMASGETLHRRRDGTTFPVEVVVSELRDASGAVTGSSAVARDVTRRRRDERALRRLATIVESSQDAIYTFDAEGTIAVWNAAAVRIFGYTADEIAGRSVRILVGGADAAERLAALIARIWRGEVVEGETPAVRNDGQLIYAYYMTFPIRDETGEIVAGAAIVRDETQRRKLQEQLRQAQKMEAVGQLAGGIAHDFNNLLTAITGYTELARMMIGDGDGLAELDEVLRAADRAASLTTQLLAFSRRQLLNPVPLDLSKVTRGVLPMLRRLIGEDIAVVEELDDALPSVLADAGQVEQVLVNLAVNARDAMPDGGVLTIATRAQALEREERSVPHVCLVVADTGVGIDGAALPRVFEPFYTTKGVGEGTGLGLATVHGVVSQSGGEVQVYSELGVGTTFKIFLPATDAVGGPAPMPAADAHGLGGTETLLVCEDEAPVRSLLERVLTRAGYRVMSYDRPEDALSVGDAELEDIDALVSDVIMPGMPGPELARMLQERRPGLPTLFLSGYAAETVHGRGSLPVGSAFLEKPFDHLKLLQTLRVLLDGAT